MMFISGYSCNFFFQKKKTTFITIFYKPGGNMFTENFYLQKTHCTYTACHSCKLLYYCILYSIHKITYLFYSIISFATVGFGDKFPTADDPLLLIAVTCYLVWGMILMTTMFSIVSSYLRTVSIKYSHLNCMLCKLFRNELNNQRSYQINFNQ